ncbi:hypothetical protein FEM48_ZijujUnG0099400 [Ziziphus jujuba var. spinosa]|uniref:ABC transporter B family member 26, chloroplastic-like n=1 Tax=Ziziphus jujuba var. spinosa TaxID=714518 RepID=A0A978U8A1_ZIZJJ|nr:hypothetical protein FEM48_ZijujUnG0099400 [Ziziphus jujuba var. spinosa]
MLSWVDYLHREQKKKKTEIKLFGYWGLFRNGLNLLGRFLFALRRLCKLFEDDRWVIFVGALIIAALSEISMPSILTVSKFSSQNGETTVFTRKSQLLVILCFTSGICSGLRSGCFAVANTILVRRLRETVYSTIISQVCALCCYSNI